MIDAQMHLVASKDRHGFAWNTAYTIGHTGSFQEWLDGKCPEYIIVAGRHSLPLNNFAWTRLATTRSREDAEHVLMLIVGQARAAAKENA